MAIYVINVLADGAYGVPDDFALGTPIPSVPASDVIPVYVNGILQTWNVDHLFTTTANLRYLNVSGRNRLHNGDEIILYY